MPHFLVFQAGFKLGYICCAQQAGVHRMIGSNCLIYLPS
jgi:hypothetical protein